MSGLYGDTVCRTVDFRTYILDRKAGPGRGATGLVRGVRKTTFVDHPGCRALGSISAAASKGVGPSTTRPISGLASRSITPPGRSRDGRTSGAWGGGS